MIIYSLKKEKENQKNNDILYKFIFKIYLNF